MAVLVETGLPEPVVAHRGAAADQQANLVTPPAERLGRFPGGQVGGQVEVESGRAHRVAPAGSAAAT